MCDMEGGLFGVDEGKKGTMCVCNRAGGVVCGAEGRMCKVCVKQEGGGKGGRVDGITHTQI